MNGNFDAGSVGSNNSGKWAYSTASGFSNPGWVGNHGLSTANEIWVASGLSVGTYALFIQSNKNITGAFQDIEITEPGRYVLEFDYVARPKYIGQSVKVYFGEIEEEGAAGSSDSTILAESDMLDAFAPNTDSAFTHWLRVVTVPAAGTYRLQFLCTSTSDKATAFDNVRLGKKPFWQVDTCNGDLYHRYAHAAASNNILTGSTCEETSVNRGGTSNASFTNPNSYLTDGDVLFPWVYYGDSYIPKVYSIQSGTIAWTFPAADIREIAVFSRWGDGNRDGIKIGGVYVMLEGSGEWTKLDVADFSYGVGNANSSPGALCAVLNRTDGGLLAERATGLKIEFPSGQDNNYTGYAEIAAYATSPRDYAWTGAAGNRLVSDAGNWNDSATGAAAGEAGETFAPADFDTLLFPASAEAVVDAPLNVFAVRLDSGVTLANPSGGSVTNTITLGKVSNSGDSAATVSCKTAFTEGYTVSFASPVVFAGGATADALGFISGDAGRVFSGDIALSGAMALTIDSEHVLTAGSRFSASALHKRDAATSAPSPAVATRCTCPLEANWWWTITLPPCAVLTVAANTMAISATPPTAHTTAAL